MGAESAAIDQAIELLGGDPARSRALRHTVSVVRHHPELWRWWKTGDQDGIRRQIVDGWLSHPAVADYLINGKLRHRVRDTESLLEAAEYFLDEQDERLATVWTHVISTPEWAVLPRSAQDLYAVLHAKARERGKLGGPHVAMCHTLAITMIEETTGRRYCKATITKARVALAAAGIITAEVGQPWTPGVKSMPTVYDLLPASMAGELCPSPRSGIVHCPTGDNRPADTRPHWTDRDRQLFTSAVQALQEGRRQAAERRPDDSFAPGQRRIATWPELMRLMDRPGGITRQEEVRPDGVVA